MGTALDQDAELQQLRDQVLDLLRQKEAAKEELAEKVRQLRRGFLSLYQRWAVAKAETEAANDRLMEKEEEVALLREESEASNYQRSSRKRQGEKLYDTLILIALVATSGIEPCRHIWRVYLIWTLRFGCCACSGAFNASCNLSCSFISIESFYFHLNDQPDVAV